MMFPATFLHPGRPGFGMTDDFLDRLPEPGEVVHVVMRFRKGSEVQDRELGNGQLTWTYDPFWQDRTRAQGHEVVRQYVPLTLRLEAHNADGTHAAWLDVKASHRIPTEVTA